MIRKLSDLADHVGAEQGSEKSIARRLYKDTSCGISFWAFETGVGVSGYCEGTDRECQAHTINYPFEADAFDKLVEQADKDGCETWDETHGCDDCGEEVDGERPINPNCKTCHGEGVVI